MAQAMIHHHDWYRGVTNEQLCMLLEEARDQAEYCPDAAEKKQWNIRVEAMQDELFERQERMEQREV